MENLVKVEILYDSIWIKYEKNNMRQFAYFIFSNHKVLKPLREACERNKGVKFFKTIEEALEWVFDFIVQNSSSGRTFSKGMELFTRTIFRVYCLGTFTDEHDEEKIKYFMDKVIKESARRRVFGFVKAFTEQWQLYYSQFITPVIKIGNYFALEVFDSIILINAKTNRIFTRFPKENVLKEIRRLLKNKKLYFFNCDEKEFLAVLELYDLFF